MKNNDFNNLKKSSKELSDQLNQKIHSLQSELNLKKDKESNTMIQINALRNNVDQLNIAINKLKSEHEKEMNKIIYDNNDEKRKLYHELEEKGKEINNLKSCNTLNESSPTKETKYSATNATNNSLSNIVNSVSNDKIFGLGITKMNGTRHIQAQNKFLETRCLNAEKARDAIATKLVSMGTELTKMQGLASELETMKQKHNNLAIVWTFHSLLLTKITILQNQYPQLLEVQEGG